HVGINDRQHVTCGERALKRLKHHVLDDKRGVRTGAGSHGLRQHKAKRYDSRGRPGSQCSSPSTISACAWWASNSLSLVCSRDLSSAFCALGMSVVRSALLTVL